MSESRSEFEAWYVETYPNGWGVARFNGSGRYCHDHPSNQWICWQASRRAALEEQRELIAAAQAVIERWDTPLWKDAPHTAIFINRMRHAIDAIRELAGKTKED